MNLALAPHGRLSWAWPIFALFVSALALSCAAPGAAQSGDEIINSLGMKFVLIPGGNFQMGSPASEGFRSDDESSHSVQLRPYYLGIFEVTQKEFESVMETNPSFFAMTGVGRNKVRPKEAPMHPVDSVTWNEAAAFCTKLSARTAEKVRKFSYRLPTEAEWEFACRAGTSSSLYYGEDVSADVANFNGFAPLGKGVAMSFIRSTWMVGAYKANAFGLYDMHGNVAEWCADWYDADYYRKSPKVNPTGPEQGEERVFRGGGWANTARACRSAARHHLPPDHSSYNIGFRLVLVSE
jgi:formylglycine-generating enzyme required for sulfatase activity